MEDKLSCGCTGLDILGSCWGQDQEVIYECDTETGVLGWTPREGTGCNSNISFTIEKCVEGQGCVPCGEDEQQTRGPGCA